MPPASFGTPARAYRLCHHFRHDSPALVSVTCWRMRVATDPLASRLGGWVAAMSDATASTRLLEAIERIPCGDVLEFATLVEWCDEFGVPLVEAAELLDELVARGVLRREVLDDDGQPVASEELTAMMAGARWGYRPHYHVAWRRIAGRDWMLA